MDKNTLSNYGWIVIAVLVLSVMIALATPFGEYIKAGVESTTQGLFDTSEKAMNVVGMSAESAPNHNGATIPKGATYTKADGIILSAGECFPETVANGDIYIYGDLEYRYNYYFNGASWAVNGNQKGWAVNAIDKIKTNYTILNSINGKNVNTLYYSFQSCTNLTDITLPDTITKIGIRSFRYCKNLKNINIPDSVTTIENETFIGCSSLVSINVDTNNTAYCSVDGVLYSENMQNLILYPCCKTDAEFIIPSGVTEILQTSFLGNKIIESITIPDSITVIGLKAFRDCSNLQTVIFDGNSTLTMIPDNCFQHCSSLVSVTIPDTVTSIGQLSFQENKITEMIIPNGVTDIKERTFENCRNMTRVVIPADVANIGYRAFSNCSGLTSIEFLGTTEQWNSITKGTEWDLYVSTNEVICSNGSVTLS